MNNEELCERILPTFIVFSHEHSGERYFDGTKDQYNLDKERLKEALTQGILIPAEKMLTVGEIEKILWDTWNVDLTLNANICNYAKAIHQSSRQKAGVKC